MMHQNISSLVKTAITGGALIRLKPEYLNKDALMKATHNQNHINLLLFY